MFHRRGIFLSIYGTQSCTLNLVRFPTSAVPNSLYYRLVGFQLFLWERKKTLDFILPLVWSKTRKKSNFIVQHYFILF